MPKPSRDDDGKHGRPENGGESKGGRASRKAFLLRLSPQMLAELRGWADQELRSLNGRIEYLLREALRRRRGGRDDDG